MTREESIKEIEHTVECCKMYLPEDDPRILALNIAISALRAQQTPTKLDRIRWEGCYWCTGFCPEVTEDPHWEYRFCPKFGRPLAEDAWADLERRINGGTTD